MSKCKNKDTVDKNEIHQYNYLILNVLKNPKAKYSTESIKSTSSRSTINMYSHVCIYTARGWTGVYQCSRLSNPISSNKVPVSQNCTWVQCLSKCTSDEGMVWLTQGTVQCLCTIPPLLAGISAALQSLFQCDHPILHLCFAVCSQEVTVAVLHLKLKAITPHLRALRGKSNCILLHMF